MPQREGDVNLRAVAPDTFIAGQHFGSDKARTVGLNDQAATPHPHQSNRLDRAKPVFRKGQSGVNPRARAALGHLQKIA